MNHDPGYTEAESAASYVEELLHRWEEFDLDGNEFIELAADKIKMITSYFENGNPPAKNKSESESRTLYEDLEEGLDQEDVENMKIYTPQPKIKKGKQGSLFE